MNKNGVFLSLLFLPFFSLRAQPGNYTDSIAAFRQQYVNTHEVVKDGDRRFLQFFPIDPSFRVPAGFEKIEAAPWFSMETSGKEKKLFRIYGILRFRLRDTLLSLQVYQSKSLLGNPDLANYLFLPFTDRTSGYESYDNGRYIDLIIPELATGNLLLDFNKAYNPYCAYVSGQYNCPLPPRENDLPVAIRAGEKIFAKPH